MRPCLNPLILIMGNSWFPVPYHLFTLEVFFVHAVNVQDRAE